MSVVDWVKLELDLGAIRDDGPVLLPDAMSIRTLAVLGDTSVKRRRIYRLNKACSMDIPGRGGVLLLSGVRPALIRSTSGAASQASVFGLTAGVAARRRRHGRPVRIKFVARTGLGLCRNDGHSPALPTPRPRNGATLCMWCQPTLWAAARRGLDLRGGRVRESRLWPRACRA